MYEQTHETDVENFRQWASSTLDDAVILIREESVRKELTEEELIHVLRTAPKLTTIYNSIDWVDYDEGK